MVHKKRKRVFICHSSHDKRFTDSLALNLQDQGVDVWYDKWSMRAGDSLHQKIADGIEACDYMVVVISNQSMASKWARQELNAALAKELERQEVFILPVFLSGADQSLPTFLKDKVYADFRSSFDEGFRMLVASITGDEPKHMLFKKALGEEDWREVWAKLPQRYHGPVKAFVSQIDNPEGLAFIEFSSRTKSAYEAMCEMEYEVGGFTGLQEWGLISFVVDAWWPPSWGRNYKMAAKLTRLGYRIAEKLEIEEVKKVNFDLLPVA